jgi:predicted CXXCH cytochrome family protein
MTKSKSWTAAIIGTFILVCGASLQGTQRQTFGAAGDAKYSGDSQACKKCHPDAKFHLDHLNAWKETAHAKEKPKDDDPPRTQYRQSTGFTAAGGKGDWLEDGVGCEMCHGPGDAHSKTKTADEAKKTTYVGKVCIEPQGTDLAKNPFPAADVPKSHKAAQTCGQCHAAVKTKAGGKEFPEGFYPKPDGSHDLLALVDSVAPGDNLKTRQYAEWWMDGKGKHASKGVWCATCHDPHAKKNHAQLRKPVNEMCGTCHKQEMDIAKHLADPNQKHVPGIKVKPDMQCLPCHMPDHSHVMSKEQAREYEEKNKATLTQ